MGDGRGTALAGKTAVARNETFSAIAAGAALACALTAFLGWIMGMPALRGFGSEIPIWPLTALGFASLAGAMLALLRDQVRIALALCALPFLLSVSGAVQALTGYNFGIHGLLFADELARVRSATPGRPAVMILLEWLMLIGAMLLASRKTWRACLCACLIASIPLVLSMTTLGLLLVGFRIPDGPGYFLWSSLPASLATILLSVSIFLWCRSAARSGIAGDEDLTGWTFARLFPVLLLLPAFTALFEIGALWLGIDALLREALWGALNILLVGGLLVWALQRTARQQGALREFAHALDSAPIAMLHPDGTIVHWSRGCERLYGWSAREAIGAQKHVLLGSASEGGACGLAELGPGMEIAREVTGTARDGRRIRVLEQARRVDGAAGTPLVILSMTDLTERAQMEADLEARRALLRAILDTVPDAMVAFDEEGIIRRFSPGAAQAFGYQPDEAIGQHFTMIAAESRREAYATALLSYLESGVAQFQGRVSRTFARRADGTDIPVELRVAEAVAGGKRLFILFLRDLTETVAFEERLGSLGAELGHVSRLSAMGEMAAGMAHELNQPLTAISNYLGTAGVLMEGEGADIGEARAMIETANRQTLRAGQIIRRMRDFVAKKQVDVEAVPVADTVRDAIALVFVGTTPREIKLDYDLDPNAHTMLADRVQIQQVLVNLLRNAVQAMQHASSPVREIVLSCRDLGNEMIEIGVCDSGPGISQATRMTLFEPFTASSDKGGMGVGLSICRRIVEAHGGEIWVEDNEGRGAAFRFTVPKFTNREVTGE